MNKITEEPLDFVVRFYYYYSYCTLILSWILGPILFYIVLTQSKKLGNFKWFILNHSFWCLMLETVFAIVKPLFLTPAAGGFQIGMLRNYGGFKSSAILTALCAALSCNCVVGVCATVGSRYLLIFPSRFNQWFNLRVALFLSIFIHLVCYSLIGYVLYPIMHLDQNIIYQWAKEYDTELEKYFIEKTFFFLPHSYHDFADILTLLFFVLTHACGAAVFFYFSYHIVTQKTQILTNTLQKLLVISSLLQMCLTSIFLFIPIMFLFFAIYFDIPNSSTFNTMLLCLLNSHCLVEYVVTLYFISPYRHFILRYFQSSRVSNFIISDTPTPLTSSGFSIP